MKTRCLLILLWVQGLTAVRWTSDTENQHTIETCSGSNLTLPWAYVLDQGDLVENVKWFHTEQGPDSTSVTVMIATYNSGIFMAVPSYAQRLHFAGDAGKIVLSAARVADSGTYAIEVIVRNKRGEFSAVYHTLDVRVEGLSSAGHMTVLQTDQAVYDQATGKLHIQLACTGPKLSQGHPQEDVIWRTPSGSEVASSSYNYNGTYYLLLDNPVKGGDYSCRLPPSASKCLQGDVPSAGEATVTVDAVTARLTLLEAKEQAFHRELGELRRENLDLRRAEIHLQEELKMTKAGLSQTNATVTKEIDVMLAKLNGFRGKPTAHVGFHAILGRSVELTSSQPVKFTRVEYNDGGAYNYSSGIFTAPIAGSYFLAFTTSPYLTGSNSNSFLSVRGQPVAKIYNRYGVNYYSMATGHAVVHLDFGEEVWVASITGKAQFFDPLSFFSGFLIHADC